MYDENKRRHNPVRKRIFSIALIWSIVYTHISWKYHDWKTILCGKGWSKLNNMKNIPYMFSKLFSSLRHYGGCMNKLAAYAKIEI